MNVVWHVNQTVAHGDRFYVSVAKTSYLLGKCNAALEEYIYASETLNPTPP
jgi:hypothetical protein